MPFSATCMQLEILILSEVRKRKTNTIYHLYVESNMWQNEPIYRTETGSGHEEQTCGCQGEERMRQTGSLGLVDANYYIQNGQAVKKSYRMTQGTESNLWGQNMMEDDMRKRMCIYMCIYIYISRSLCCTTEIGTKL